MGFRFRKVLTLMPGVRLNLSKSGVSASVGKPGATLNVGPRGVYGTVGIPGSGLSYRAKLDSPSTRSDASADYTSPLEYEYRKSERRKAVIAETLGEKPTLKDELGCLSAFALLIGVPVSTLIIWMGFAAFGVQCLLASALLGSYYAVYVVKHLRYENAVDAIDRRLEADSVAEYAIYQAEQEAELAASERRIEQLLREREEEREQELSNKAEQTELYYRTLEEQTEQAASELRERFGDETAERILNGEVWLGQSREQLTESLGQPEAVSQSVTARRTRETFKYHPVGRNRYETKIFLENGIVVGWEMQ